MLYSGYFRRAVRQRYGKQTGIRVGRRIGMAATREFGEIQMDKRSGPFGPRLHPNGVRNKKMERIGTN